MRRTLTTLAVVAAVLLVALLGLWLARVPLASAWLAGALERHGYPAARFEITYLGWSRAVIEDLAAATGEDPRAERVEARYSPWMLLSGDVRGAELTISGLQVSLAPWAGDGADAAPGQPAPADPGELMAALGGLPALRLEGARVAIASPLGTWRIEADGELGQAEGGPEGDLAATARNERLRVDGRLDARLRPGRLDAVLSATEDDGFAVRVDAQARSPWREPRLELEIESDLPAAADLPWALLPGPALAEGRMQLAATGSGRLATDALPQGMAAWLRRLAAGGWSGEWRAEGSGLALAHRFSDAELAASGRLTAAEGGARVVAEAGSRLAVGAIHPSLRGQLPAGLADAPQARGPMTLTWPGGELLRVGVAEAGSDGLRVTAGPAVTLTWPEAPGRLEAAAGVDATLAPDRSLQRLSVSGLRVRGNGLDLGASRIDRLALTGSVEDALGQEAAGEMDLSLTAPRLALGPAVLTDVTLELPGRVEPGESGPRVALADSGRLEAGAWRAGERIEGEGPVRATVAAGQVSLGLPAGADVTLAADAFAARVQRAGGVERLEVDPGRVRVVADAEGWRVRLPAARAGLPARGITAGGVAAVLRPGDGRRLASFDIERIEHAADPAWLAPTTVSGRVTRNAGGFSVEGDGRIGRAGVPVRFAGELATDAGVGDLQVELPTVRFRPDGLQPAALAPALGALQQVDGRAGGSLRLQMRPGSLDGRARLRVEDLAFAADALRVRGLEGSVSLDGLRPPRAAPVQSLRAERIDAAVPISDARVRFGVVQPPGGGMALRIVEGSGGVFGGTARVNEWTFDPDAQVHNVGVQLDGIELQEVLAYLDIDGLVGEGRLSGGLPATLAGRSVAVREGRLRSGDGRIRFRSAHADEAFAEADRSVRTMLLALRDFEYDRMDVAIEQPLGREGEIRILLEGRNPGVMDGRRFRFDIRLAGDFDPLVEALRAGRPLSDALIERHLDLRQPP